MKGSRAEIPLVAPIKRRERALEKKGGNGEVSLEVSPWSSEEKFCLGISLFLSRYNMQMRTTGGSQLLTRGIHFVSG